MNGKTARDSGETLSSLGVIPARYDSTRFPGKPLADLHGKPMVVRVYERAVLSKLDRLIVATDDNRIREACEREGVPVMLTRHDHVSGTDRVAEVAINFRADIVLNIQGDEPLISPSTIDRLVGAFSSDPLPEIVTACIPITDQAELDNPNLVKLTLDEQGRVLDFSRGKIPGISMHYGHVGIYAFRRDVLKRFVSLPPSIREKRENLEQLRALENDMMITCIRTERPGRGVDTLEDLEKVREQWTAIHV